MKKENDILKDCMELKQMPYKVPEGYFESFKAEAVIPAVRKINFWNRMAPYAAMAAVFVFLVTAGTLLLEKSVPQYQMTEEDYLMFSDNMMTSIAYEMEFGDQLADAQISEEDIINYLIYTGVTPEHIELAK